MVDSPKVCFIAHNALGALTGGGGGHIGGAERQTSLMSRWLANRGMKISVITWGDGTADELRDRVRIIKVCRPDVGIPGLRQIHPRLTSLFAGLRKANADVYYHNSAEYLTGPLAAWCHYNGKQFVYSVASDVACDPRLPAMSKRYERVCYRYGLRHAHSIIVQSERQQRMLQKGFGLDSVVFPMPGEGPDEGRVSIAYPTGLNRLLWVGRMVPLKRLEWFLDMAEALPRVIFEVAVGNDVGNQYAITLRTRAAQMKNVIWHGAVSHQDLPELYRRATCLVCTSEYEGFPNTFLEAWSHGIPVISSFDPDDLISRRNLGRCGQTVSGLIKGFEELTGSTDAWMEAAQNARCYFLHTHEVGMAMLNFERHFIEMSNVKCKR